MKQINVKNCYKSYDQQPVLENCSLAVKQGEIYALLGKNGAGKSTLFKLLTGLAQADMGEIEILGRARQDNDKRWLVDLGFFVNEPVFYGHLTATENLALHLAYMDFPTDNIAESLRLVGLEPDNEQPVKTYSMGMKQRLGIARALSHDPQLLILDEPINGLDPAGIRQMRKLFIKLVKEEGKTLVISSHILAEIEQVADRVGVLVAGEIIVEKDLAVLKQEHGTELENYLIDVMEGLKS